MKNLLTLVFGALLFASSVNATSLNNETVRSVMSEMGKINSSMKSILSENDGIVSTNETLIKKNRLWQGQLDTRLKPLITVHLAKSKKHIDNEKRISREINRYNSACNKTFRSKTPAYHKCTREKPVLDRVSRKHMAEKRVLQAERARLTKEEASYIKLIDDNNKKINKNFKRHLEIKDTVGRYEKRLEYYRTRLITLCSTADRNDDGESLHYCQSMRWDRAKKNLPPLEKILKGTRFFGR